MSVNLSSERGNALVTAMLVMTMLLLSTAAIAQMAGDQTKESRRERAREVLESVGMDPDVYGRRRRTPITRDASTRSLSAQAA